MYMLYRPFASLMIGTRILVLFPALLTNSICLQNVILHECTFSWVESPPHDAYAQLWQSGVFDLQPFFVRFLFFAYCFSNQWYKNVYYRNANRVHFVANNLNESIFFRQLVQHYSRLGAYFTRHNMKCLPKFPISFQNIYRSLHYKWRQGYNSAISEGNWIFQFLQISSG